IGSSICTAGCTVERIGRNPRGESIYRRLMDGNVHWASCRKHMMCPVVVANEMSGLKGRVGVGSHPHWRLKVDAVISGPSFGAGNEDQRSHYKGDQWKD